MSSVIPDKLILAREVRELTQTELAEITGVVQGSISKYEGGIKQPSERDLEAIATALKFPVEFFQQPGQRHGVESGEIFHRKQRSLSQRQTYRINALLNIFRLHTERLLDGERPIPPYGIPRYDPREFNGNIEEIANAVRAAWEIPPGPVDHLVARLEAACMFVYPVDFGTDQIDETVQWNEPTFPVILINKNAPGDRLRYSLAHALGHLVMHHRREPYEGMEEEADRFAAAFLMPADDIKGDLYPVTIEHLLQLKPAWKVSMQALIRRALDLNLINESRYKSMFSMLSRAGYRKKEPFMLDAERPSLFRRVITHYRRDLKFSISELAKFLWITESDLKTWYIPELAPFRIVDKDSPDISEDNLSNA